MISCLILTKNEEINLPYCLAALRWCDDVLVLDSGSTDRTLQLAKEAGARVFHRDWDTERNQREYSLTLPFRHPWVYNPDADEVLLSDLCDEMHSVVADPTRRHVAYRARFKVMFLERWVRHASIYPTWVVRLFRPECLSFERDINLRYVVDGSTGFLQGHFEHHTFRRGLHHWYTKHNDYSSIEANEALRLIQQESIEIAALLDVNPVRRRKAWKELSLRIPGRALLSLGYLLFIRGGVLDGPAGWAYCGIRASYELMIELKILELQRTSKST